MNEFAGLTAAQVRFKLKLHYVCMIVTAVCDASHCRHISQTLSQKLPPFPVLRFQYEAVVITSMVVELHCVVYKICIAK